MSLDAYDPCPCGSGKKLKFCCQSLVGDMEKVIRLQENNQPRVALARLKDLEKSHPGNSWVVTCRAAILLSEQRSEEAKDVLETFVATHPDHLFGLVLYATAAFTAGPFELAKPAIHRAFQHCVGAYPQMVGSLAMGIAGIMFGSHRHMATRQHLTLAMQLASGEDRQNVFLRLLEFDSQEEIPYPLRSVHQLVEYTGSEDIEKEAAKATRLSDMGCWEPAARLFTTLAEQEPDNAALWQNVGFCWAWDGEESTAAEALHLAARLHDDFETAVECETLAQLLDLNSTEEIVRMLSPEFRIASVSKLLTLLGGHDHFARLDISPELADEESAEQLPTGVFDVLDRPQPTDAAAESLTLDSVPNVLASLAVFDAAEDQPAKAYVTGFEGEPLDVALRLLQEAAGGELEADTDDDGEDDDFVQGIPQELYPLHWDWYFPPRTPVVLRRKLEAEQWQHALTRLWPETKLAALAGKTPREVAGDAEQTVPLSAAVYVLDSFCERNQYVLDFELLRERLQLQKPRPIEVTENTQLNSFSAMQLHRLPVGRLSDSQLSYVLNRASLIHHRAFLYAVLTEALSRPTCLDTVDLNRVYRTLVELCCDQFRRDEALEWIEKGREWAKTQEKAFELTLQWDLRELKLRLEDPSDSGLTPLLKHLWESYGSKLPQLRTYLINLVETYGIAAPWEAVATAAGTAGSTTEGGIWTPETAAQSQGGPNKLWLPGQE